MHLPDVFCRAGCLFGLSLIARLAGALAGRPLIVRLAEGASQSRFCRASLGLADGSEPSGRGGTTMRLLGRRGFGPGRLLTGSGFGPGAAFDRVFFVRRGFGSGRR